MLNNINHKHWVLQKRILSTRKDVHIKLGEGKVTLLEETLFTSSFCFCSLVACANPISQHKHLCKKDQADQALHDNVWARKAMRYKTRKSFFFQVNLKFNISD